MTPQKEQRDEKEGILEQMLQSLKAIGQDVQRTMYRCGLYSTGVERKNHDEWSPDELYNNENGEY